MFDARLVVLQAVVALGGGEMVGHLHDAVAAALWPVVIADRPQHLLAPRRRQQLLDKRGAEHGVLIAEVALRRALPGVTAGDRCAQHQLADVV